MDTRSALALLLGTLACLTALACASDTSRTHDEETMHDPHGGHGATNAHGTHGAQGSGIGKDVHGHHRFDDVEKWTARFEDPERDAWQRPDVVIAALGLAPSSKVADIGAATGYFPVRIAPLVPNGVVYGVDIEPAMVNALAARATREGHANLRAVLATTDDARLPEPVDVVLIVNTVHHIEERVPYFARLKQSLTSGARLVVVDFKMGELPHGPPPHMRLAPDRVVEELAQAGYALTARDEASLPYQYVLVFTPRA